MSQLSLFEDPAPAPVAEVVPTATGLRARLMEALRRDVDSLSGPPEYIAGEGIKALLEERVADYRRRLAALEEEER